MERCFPYKIIPKQEEAERTVLSWRGGAREPGAGLLEQQLLHQAGEPGRPAPPLHGQPRHGPPAHHAEGHDRQVRGKGRNSWKTNQERRDRCSTCLASMLVRRVNN